MDYSYLTAATAFSDSDNSSSVHFPIHAGTSLDYAAPTAEVDALHRLSDNLGSAFQSPDFDFLADARIVVGPRSDGGGGALPCEFRVHQCVLSARSPFFKEEFARRRREPSAPLPVTLELKELVEEVDVGYDALVVVLGYLYTGKLSPLPKEVWMCVDEECQHEACRTAVDFVMEMLYASFVFQISELVSLFQRHLLDILEKVAIDDIPMVLYVAKLCENLCVSLVNKCIDIIIKSDLDIITLEKTVPPDLAKQIMDSRLELGLVEPESSGFPDKHVRRIHKALDIDDLELVRMLLIEGNTTLDDACALHYAVAFCDPKITTELLDLALADVNHRNLRGYTVLHIAAMRKEPKIIVSLLTKGARPSDLTSDGKKAIQIAKRLTKSVEYLRSTGEGEASPKSRLCIEILEQAERRDPQLGGASFSLAIAGDDLRGKLLYLENRVSLARLLFPMEAKVAMDIAQVDGTLEFTLGLDTEHSNGNPKTTTMKLDEAPVEMKEALLRRIKALSRTVELGKQFFPRCSNVIDKIMDDEDHTDLTTGLGHKNSEEKRRRFLELQDVLLKAFSEDKEEFDRSALPSTSLSTSSMVVHPTR